MFIFQESKPLNWWIKFQFIYRLVANRLIQIHVIKHFPREADFYITSTKACIKEIILNYYEYKFNSSVVHIYILYFLYSVSTQTRVFFFFFFIHKAIIGMVKIYRATQQGINNITNDNRTNPSLFQLRSKKKCKNINIH